MKKMIKIAFVAAFAAIAGYGVYANQNIVFITIEQPKLIRNIRV